MLSWLRRIAETFGGAPRSSRWPTVRKQHLAKEPACIACGRARELEVHHVEPFHLKPELELDPKNLCTLCADPCHFVFGHLLDWRKCNPMVREDAARYFDRVTQHGA